MTDGSSSSGPFMLSFKDKMVSCIKIETASLIFACLSVLTTLGVFFQYGTSMVRVFIALANLITSSEEKTVVYYKIRDYTMFNNVLLSILLGILVVFFAFSIILTKGLLTKNSHLVKGYFICGVTGNTVAVLFGIFLTVSISVKVGMLTLLGCFMYSLILMMIRKTYLKLATDDYKKCCPKDVDAEKTISIKL